VVHAGVQEKVVFLPDPPFSKFVVFRERIVTGRGTALQAKRFFSLVWDLILKSKYRQLSHREPGNKSLICLAAQKRSWARKLRLKNIFQKPASMTYCCYFYGFRFYSINYPVVSINFFAKIFLSTSSCGIPFPSSNSFNPLYN
jgi:hypothetical protein